MDLNIKTLVNTLAILACIFCTKPLYAQFDVFSTPTPNAPIKPEKLNKFIRDSIEEHQKKIVNIGTPYKYCLPHVCLNRMGKYALVGFDHQPVTAFEFDDIKGNWHDNVLIVRKDKLSGCIDTTGKWLLPVQYPQLSFTHPGRLISTGMNSKYAFVFNFQGKSVLPEVFQYAGTMDWGSQTVIKARKEFGDTLYLFDLRGNKLNAYAAYNVEPLGSGNGNRYAVQLSADQWTSKEMVVDSNFRLVAPAVSRRAFWANDTWVCYGKKDQQNPEMYSIPAQKFYPVDGMISPLKNHSALVILRQNKRGLLNDQLKTIVPPKFFSIEHLAGYDLFIVLSHQYKYGLMDEKGKMVLDTVYSSIQRTKISDFLEVAGTLYRLDNKTFIEGYPTIITPDLYLLRPDAGPDRLMHKNGKYISTVNNIWRTPNLMVAVQKESSSNQVEVYDRSGKLLRALDMGSLPKSMEIPNKAFYTWTDSNGKVGVLDPDFNPIIQPQYAAIHLLSNIPEKFVAIWAKYTFRNPEHLYLGWIWNNDQTAPLLIKENGEVVSIIELDYK